MNGFETSVLIWWLLMSEIKCGRMDEPYLNQCSTYGSGIKKISALISLIRHQ